MKKIKKILAAVMTLAMVLGMSMTTFAATSNPITITNAGTGSFKAVQIVVMDTTADTGWEIATEYQDEFETAFEEDDTQVIIKGMIASLNPNADEAEPIADFDEKYQAALEAICSTIDMETGTTPAVEGTATLTVTSTSSTSGVWAINGTEDNYTYSPMAAYIDFAGVVTPATGINAKKAPTSIDKDTTDDGVYEVGETIEYTIDGRVPFIPTSDNNRQYIVTDTITNAHYDVDGEGALEVTVTVKESQASDATSYSQTYDVTPTGNTFMVDLADFLLQDDDGTAANPYQNWYLTISYAAVTEATTVGNTVSVDDGSATGTPTFGSDSTYEISGTVTLTKTGEDEYVDGLPGAKFVVVKTTTEDPSGGDPISTEEYGTFDDEGLLTGWEANIEDATELTTDNKGQITVKGLDPAFTGYTFREVEAPAGYSISDTDATITWGNIPSKEQITSSTTEVQGTSELENTKLASLPSTGGIGTTIFTIGGCVIMIAAAGLFFASRRKSSK